MVLYARRMLNDLKYKTSTRQAGILRDMLWNRFVLKNCPTVRRQKLVATMKF